MHGLKRIPLLGWAALAALLVPALAFPAWGAAKKQQKKDATKPAASKGLLPDGQKLTAEQLAQHIDKLIANKIKAEKIALSSLTDDSEFLRRVYLDLTGRIPPADKVSFLDSKETNKRAKLIDELLASKDYGKHMADVWQALLLPRSSVNRRLEAYYPNVVTWLEERFNANDSWDKMTKAIVTATGDASKPSPVAYWLANSTPDKATDNITRMFLGVQLQCAQCHNHPFTDWKRDEYWHMAAFFAKVRPEGNPRQAARNGNSITISEKGGGKGRRRPTLGKVLPPKFLGGEQPKVKNNDAVRPVLAEWLANANNPWFSRAMVNRTWGQLFGRGFINPVDDMHDGNANSHPELLADLSRQFATNGFDLKYLLRAICNSQTYQRSSKPTGNNADAPLELFARMAIKPLTPGQLYDSLTLLMGTPNNNNGGRRAGGGAARFRGSPRTAFVNSFGIEDGADPTEYQAGIPQVLRLMNSPQLNRATPLGAALRSAGNKDEVTEKLYLAVLARRPTTEESTRIADFLRKQDNQREGFTGVLWVLLNSSEFALNR